jgi:hypothetical protein
MWALASDSGMKMPGVTGHFDKTPGVTGRFAAMFASCYCGFACAETAFVEAITGSPFN